MSVLTINRKNLAFLTERLQQDIQEKGVAYALRKILGHTTKKISGIIFSANFMLSVANALRNSDKIFFRRLSLKVKEDESRDLTSIGNTDNFPFEYEERTEFIKFWENKYSDDLRIALQKAGEYLKHKFTIFERSLKLGPDIDWYKDPLTNKSWPKKYYNNIDYSTDKRLSDIKYSLELNKHLHLVTLGKAYHYTKDEKYAEEFVNQISGWIKQNPPYVGINWIGNIKIAQRMVSWILCFHLFRDSNHLKNDFLKEFAKSIYHQTDALYNRRRSYRNNQRVAALCGSIITGIVFPEFKKSGKWVSDGLKELGEALKDLVFEGGVYREQTTSYEKTVVEFLLLTYIIAERNRVSVPPKIKSKLYKLLNHLMYLRTPDGRLPILGDNSDERGYALSDINDFWNVDTLSSAGAILYSDSNLKKVSTRYTAENFWLFGTEDYEKWERVRSLKGGLATNKSFEDGGHFVIRSGWEKNDDYLFIRCGEFGFDTCGHSHCDLLSPVLYISGVPILVDSGTFRYNTTKDVRDYYRKVSAHNTIQVDGVDQAEMVNTFLSKSKILDAKCIEFKDGHFKGYLRDERGIKHTREVDLQEKGHWFISDVVDIPEEDRKIHNIKWFFNVAPGLEVKVSKNGRSLRMTGDAVSVEVKLDVCNNRKIRIERAFVSPRYGVKKQHDRIVLSMKSKLPVSQKFEFIRRPKS